MSGLSHFSSASSAQLATPLSAYEGSHDDRREAPKIPQSQSQSQTKHNTKNWRNRLAAFQRGESKPVSPQKTDLNGAASRRSPVPSSTNYTKTIESKPDTKIDSDYQNKKRRVSGLEDQRSPASHIGQAAGKSNASAFDNTPSVLPNAAAHKGSRDHNGADAPANIPATLHSLGFSEEQLAMESLPAAVKHEPLLTGNAHETFDGDEVIYDNAEDPLPKDITDFDPAKIGSSEPARHESLFADASSQESGSPRPDLDAHNESKGPSPPSREKGKTQEDEQVEDLKAALRSQGEGKQVSRRLRISSDSEQEDSPASVMKNAIRNKELSPQTPATTQSHLFTGDLASRLFMVHIDKEAASTSKARIKEEQEKREALVRAMREERRQAIIRRRLEKEAQKEAERERVRRKQEAIEERRRLELAKRQEAVLRVQREERDLYELRQEQLRQQHTSRKVAEHQRTEQEQIMRQKQKQKLQAQVTRSSDKNGMMNEWREEHQKSFNRSADQVKNRMEIENSLRKLRTREQQQARENAQLRENGGNGPDGSQSAKGQSQARPPVPERPPQPVLDLRSFHQSEDLSLTDKRRYMLIEQLSKVKGLDSRLQTYVGRSRDPGMVPTPLVISKENGQSIHVFVDASNITWAFKEACSSLGWSKMPRLDIQALRIALERGRPAAKRIIVGSNPTPQPWADALELDYEVIMLERVNAAKARNSGLMSRDEARTKMGKVEQGVDELLHMKMLESVVDFVNPSTMVLVTGDGNIAQFSGGFFKMVERALAFGWTVEVVAFEKNISSLWLDSVFCRRWDKQFRVFLLDNLVHYLTDERPLPKEMAQWYN